jgi:hypothetical protein
LQSLFPCFSTPKRLLPSNTHAPTLPRESLSADQKSELLRVTVSDLRQFAAQLDEAQTVQTPGLSAQGTSPDGGDLPPQPLVDALDAALFRKQVSALHSWREWVCWANDTALRLGCVPLCLRPSNPRVPLANDTATGVGVPASPSSSAQPSRPRTHAAEN